MVGARIVETNEGIQNEFNVEIFDKFKRKLRDRGWIETDQIINSGISSGTALEIGPGPGYVGLEWLKRTKGTRLTGLEISPAMIGVAEKNAGEYALSDRVKYVQHNAVNKFPFPDNSFDGVFANESLHEWENPKSIFDEIHRVLKPGGRYFISDFRRDINPLVKYLMLFACAKEIREGFLSSLNASYLAEELKTVLGGTRLNRSEVKSDLMGLSVTGVK
jgi:ubiquinone/menaquinone biosynthesis C-methylase UbiE